MRQSKNVCRIVGLVNSVEVRRDIIKSSGMDYISIKMDVNTGTPDSPNPVKVEAFASKMKKDGSPNKIYKELDERVSKMKTVEKDGLDRAQKVRITTATMKENVFVVDDGEREVSIPVFSSNFFNEAAPTDNFEATFEVEIVVAKKEMETASDGTETGRMIVTGIIADYGDKVSVVKFIVENPNAIAFFKNQVDEADTMSIRGKINNLVTTSEEVITPAFGEPIHNTRTKTLRELIITAGQNPYLSTDANAFAAAEISAALDVRAANIKKLKEEAKKAPSAPKADAKGKKSSGFGF